MRSITLIRPDDWHVHLRDGVYLKDTVAHISRYFGRAIVMPNLVPVVDNPETARQYHDRIVSLVPKDSKFKPLMTLHITPETSEETVVNAKQQGFIYAFKLYPAGATTNSASGVSDIKTLYPVFDAMQTHAMPLCIHAEVTRPDVDIFDREAAFIDESLLPISRQFPELKVIIEHITTKQAVDVVLEANDNMAATITPHHLLFNRNHMLEGGLKPLYYCLPVLKRSHHQRALIDAATSANPKFFLGTDSAPHPRMAKEKVCGCAAGIYTAHAAIELYAEAFDNAGSLDRLEAFSSFNGPDFYGLPRNQDTITLTNQAWDVPQALQFGNDEVVPIRANAKIHWTVRN
ncbi:MAG TPA: dihydroorotase [Pseudomonadales bacterium]|jgi:dihydroorotase|nr:dihydroorotase [Gammaproteobacteria bacterium]MDP6024475.1 dihydroorotase [Pseudomonadales bacterium]MDP6316912.1 dihydroorotase [Pseudomonadales bacterium]MDP7313873.1 dihydroorotase [Pseudomonadales bacterium]HJL60813.1 dihydroorotase [Pseudomonadales bacterium]|tara:strand:+ start:708 stop:1745 length:1038 start_codon:yes stop_codon:yes gene_type:complete